MPKSIARNAFQFPLQHNKTGGYYNCHCNKQDKKLSTLSNRLSLQSFTMTKHSKLQLTYSKYKFFPWSFAFTKMTTTTTNQLNARLCSSEL